MTALLQWLWIPILVFLIILFKKGSPVVIKSALLIIPVLVITAWFANDGAFNGNGGLARFYGLLSLIVFLFCYEIGLLVYRLYRAKNNIVAKEDGVLLIIGLLLLALSIINILSIISK